MNRKVRIDNLRASINAMQSTLRDLVEEERVDSRMPDECPECGRRQISGDDHFRNCSKAGLTVERVQ